MVSKFDFSLFIIIFDLTKECPKKALFSFSLNLGQNHPTVDMEVVGGTLANALADRHMCSVFGQGCFGPHDALDCVTLVGRGEVSKGSCVVELVDRHLLLPLEHVAEGGGKLGHLINYTNGSKNSLIWKLVNKPHLSRSTTSKIS